MIPEDATQTMPALLASFQLPLAKSSATDLDDFVVIIQSLIFSDQPDDALCVFFGDVLNRMI